jgi:hypothetical protein
MTITYEVQYRLVKTCSKEVTVDSYNDVRRALSAEVPEGYWLQIDDVRQTSEPWVSGDWYDLAKPRQVLVLRASFGNTFVDGDLALLEQRINAAGLQVTDRWNGTQGCDSASFLCSQRPGPLTEEQRSIIFAPRPA